MTPGGSRQARDLAGVLSDMPIDLIKVSAFKRARQSVAPLAAKLGLPILIDPRLNERTLSPAPISDWREAVRASFEDPDFRAPGGESAREVLKRGWACLDELAKGDYRLPLAVTHGNLMSLILHSLDAGFGYAGWANLTNPDVYVLHLAEDGQWSFRRVWRSCGR